ELRFRLVYTKIQTFTKTLCCKNASRAETPREAKMQHGLLCCGLVFTTLPLDLAGFDQLAQDVLDILAAQAALEELLDVARLHGMLASDVGQDLLIISPRSFCGRKSCAASARAWPAIHATPTPHSMSDRSTLALRPQRPAARMVASRTAVSAQRAR